MGVVIDEGTAGVEVPSTPSAEAWAAMSARERYDFEVHAGQVLASIAETMGEGRPHSTAKSRALDVLRSHFDRAGRRVYLGSELPVLYPGEPIFAPDVFAVLDVDDPGEADTRMAWSVADEGRSLDFVLEVLHGAKPSKDLVANMRFYARLGIPEYFVYDRRTERLVAQRLVGGMYEPVPLHLGRYPSAVLGLDLAVVGRRLRFYSGTGELADSREIIEQLGELVRNVELRADQEQLRAEQAVSLLQRAVAGVLERGAAPLDATQRARLESCTDPTELERWLEAALAGRREF